MRAWWAVALGATLALCGTIVTPSAIGAAPEWRPTNNLSDHVITINDDIADFSQYLKDHRKTKEVYGSATERAGLHDDALLMNEGLESVLSSWGRRGGRQVDEGNDADASDDESQEPQDSDAEETDSETSTAAGPPQPSEEESSEEESQESEVHMPEPRCVKDKYVALPEPMLYNDSHIVSSLVYSMIPFRSPLLSLLDPDRHAKYIMIKVDPVLSWAPAKCSSLYEEATGREARLEQSLIELLDKSIAHELSGDRTVAAIRSRVKNRQDANRRANPISYN